MPNEQYVMYAFKIELYLRFQTMFPRIGFAVIIFFTLFKQIRTINLSSNIDTRHVNHDVQ